MGFTGDAPCGIIARAPSPKRQEKPRPNTVHYTRAPVAEAVIDLQVSFDEAPSPTIEQLEALARGLPSFPQLHRLNSISMALGPGGPDGAISSNTSTAPMGVRLTNAGGDRVLQLRRQGISYSHMQPYSEWESFSREFKPLWQKYVTDFRPAFVDRLAVRYINRISVPQGVDLERYLNVSPRLLDAVCPDVEGYFLQLVMPQRDLGDEWKVILNTGLEASSTPYVMSVLLDIDVFCVKRVPVDDVAVWATLEALRDRKNKVFEAAITDQVRRMIE